jgi:hypothetical protein
MQQLIATGVVVIALVVLVAGHARADGCNKSRDHILASASGDAGRTPQSYQNLLKICLETLQLPNVKDAFVLKDGGIAVIPKQDGAAATAQTLARFCDRYPRATLRFITQAEQRRAMAIDRIVQMSSTGATSCKKIKGLA